MADKYLRLLNGIPTEKELTVTSAGVADAGKGVALDSGGKLDQSVLPEESVMSAVASEDLAAGDYVNLHLAGGVLKARKADATAAGKEADGFVKAAFLTGATAIVFGTGSNAGVSGKTIAARQWLSTTAGQTQESPPSASGNVVQSLGKAISSAEIDTKIGQHYVLA